ncbi:MAG: 5-oxoprolinase subunit PxpB [Burkholderiaceae bacterium]
MTVHDDEGTTAGAGTNRWRIMPLGDRALIVAFEERVDPIINRTVRTTAERLLAAAIAGVVDVVPAFCSVAVYYRPERIADGGSAERGSAAAARSRAPHGTRPAWQSPYERLEARIAALLAEPATEAAGDDRLVRIPVRYGGRFGPDLQVVADATGLSPDGVIAAHTGSAHRVYMLGFSPGFPYIGGLDPRLSMPRRKTPRTRIAPGTVAIARDQTAIYTFETPGGWNLIGRTPLTLFDPGGDPPCLLRPGDRLQFEPIDDETFEALQSAPRAQPRAQPPERPPGQPPARPTSEPPTTAAAVAPPKASS